MFKIDEYLRGGSKDVNSTYKIKSLLYQPLGEHVYLDGSIDNIKQAKTTYGLIEQFLTFKPNEYLNISADSLYIKHAGFFQFLHIFYDDLGNDYEVNIFDFTTDKQTSANVDEILIPSSGADLERLVLRLHEVYNLSLRGLVDNSLTPSDTITLNIYYFNLGQKDTDVNLSGWVSGDMGVPFSLSLKDSEEIFIHYETITLTPSDIVTNNKKLTDWQKLTFLENNKVTDIVITLNTTPSSGTFRLQAKVDDFSGFIYSPYKVSGDSELEPPMYEDANGEY